MSFESSRPAIRVTGVGKRYHIWARPQDRLKQLVFGRFGRTWGKDFWALRNATFEVAPGQTVGIIGRNGSGKSTLLQLIAGVLEPSEGRVEVRGRVSALLELGAGFNPEFTGRENVRLAATILGLGDQEIAARFDEIAAFADIGDFMDQPVKIYSSGMYVRLAFAVQTCVKPDIFLVDEALAVGDIYFTQKCYARMQALRDQGTALLFVSHNMDTVSRLCSRVVYLEHGTVVDVGAPQPTIGRYLAAQRGSPLNPGISETAETVSAQAAPVPTKALRHGDQAMRIIGFGFGVSAHRIDDLVEAGQRVQVWTLIECHEDGAAPNVGFQIRDHTGTIATGANTRRLGVQAAPAQRGQRLKATFELELLLGSGEYTLTLAVVGNDDQARVFDWIDQVHSFRVTVRREDLTDGRAACPARAELKPI